MGRHCRLLVLFALGALAGLSAAAVPDPQLCTLIGRYLERDYYDPGRIRPQLMLTEAMRALEGAHIAIDAEIEADRLVLRIGQDRHAFPKGALTDLPAVMNLLQAVQGVLVAQDRFHAEQRQGLVYGMLNGALRTLDPHTLILPPEPAQEFSEDVIAGEFTGIGAYLKLDEGRIMIDRVMPGLPADTHGIEDGDVILGIDGESAAGLSLSEAVRRIKGPKGTTVRLQIERNSDDAGEERCEIPVVRDRVQPITMRSYRAGQIGYVRMDEFAKPTYKDMRVHLQKLKYAAEEPLLGLVLDLRFNGGGRLDMAYRVSDLFLPMRREVVRTVRLGDKPVERMTSRSQLIEVPMLVLVGPSSASAAEILSGALQQNDRAVVIGQTTFGKGSVQTWRQLPDDSFIKYTIQEYQLRDGVSIQGCGVQPDVILSKHAQRKDGRIDMVPYTRSGEADNEYALGARTSYHNEARYRLYWVQDYQDEATWERHRIAHPDFRPDQEAQLAMDLLERTLAPLSALQDGAPPSLDRAALLDALAQPLAARERAETLRLGELMHAYDPELAWGAPTNNREHAVPLQLSQGSAPGAVDAGTRVQLPLRVSNQGEQPIGRLYGVVETDDASPFWEAEVVFGEVAPAAHKEALLELEIPPRNPDAIEHFEVLLFQQGRDSELARLPVVLPISGQARPVFNYAWRLADTDGDGQLSLDEDAVLHLTLRNEGRGAAVPSVLFVRKEDNPFVQLKAARWEIPALAPGAEETVALPLRVLGELTVGSQTRANERSDLRLSVIAEERFEEQSNFLSERLYHELVIPLDQPAPAHTLRQPQIVVDGYELVASELDLRWRILDDNPATAAIFLGSDKVAMTVLDDTQPESTQHQIIDLAPGMNDLRLVVEDADGLTRMLLKRLWVPGSVSDVVQAAPVPTPVPVEDMP